ncbi:MAG: GGDEF domain-containing protein, partial [Rhodospirillaceae bacterium]|nr:GGDEF domain-containing protein [Rhodospirillaceae bacterium]
LSAELTGFKPGERWLREGKVGDWNVLVAPCVRNKKLNGMICLWRKDEWSDDARLLVADISGQLGITIEQIINHENILQLSRTDSMTGLLNRRAFYEEELPRRFKRLAFDGNSGALFYVDMDNFKRVNDVHGHQAGDDAIIALRDLLLDFVRPGDLVARLGGDEFALWLDGVEEKIASSRCEYLLKQSRSLAQYSGEAEHPLGISVGIAIYRPGTDESLDSLLARADSAMYEVKQKSKGNFRLAKPYEA